MAEISGKAVGSASFTDGNRVLDPDPLRPTFPPGLEGQRTERIGSTSHQPGLAGELRPIVGREAENEALEAFLDAVGMGAAALIVQGEPGIGKTTLWKHGVEEALRRSYRILACRPVEAETRLSFAGLGDLLQDVVDDVLSELPEPQREALEVALLRVPALGPRPDQRAVSLAVLGALRLTAGVGPVVLAVDDLQWLDRPSARVLRFALRRLDRERVGVLAAVRGSDEGEDLLGLSSWWPNGRIRQLQLGPLTMQALSQLLDARLGTTLPRQMLQQLYRVSGGNPFYALEIAQALWRRGLTTEIGHSLPIPETLHELIRDRLDGLPAAAREVLEIAAALNQPSVGVVRAASTHPREAESGVAAAARAGVIEINQGRIRFAHPLFASVVYEGTSLRRRRALHRRLAGVVGDVEERAKHLAFSASGPDPGVADSLDEAARRALARGAPDAAAELWEMASGLTPTGDLDGTWRRTVAAALAHFDSGDAARARKLLEEVVASSSAGPARAEVLRQLGMVIAAEESWRAAALLFNQALEESGEDPALRRAIEQDLGYAALWNGDLVQAEFHARAALGHADSLGDPAALAESLGALAYLEFVLGQGIRLDLTERALAFEQQISRWWLVLRPSFAFAQMLKYSDRLGEARARFRSLVELATERGQENPIPVLLYHLAELECWAGDWEAASRYADRALEAARQTGMAFYGAMAHYAKALVDAHLGRVEPARRAAEEGLRIAERTGVAITKALNLSVLGFLGLSTGDFGSAHGYLAQAVELAVSMGVGDPGFLHHLPDEIESLIALGRLEEARAKLEPFEQSAGQLDRAWARAAAARCRGLLEATEGDLPGALRTLDQALLEHERLGQPFELARTLLVVGTIRRRAKQKREARACLERAQAILDRLGAAQWSAIARSELGRIGGRAPSRWGLTPTEERVADLVAAGRTNREAANALFLSVNTVESNLKKIYRKLEVHSRAELPRALGRYRGPPA
jgi:DNA-binding CsgD family transcriptional regulator